MAIYNPSFAAGTSVREWMLAGTLGISILAVAGVLLLLTAQGLTHFWPANILAWEIQEGGSPRELFGQVIRVENLTQQQITESRPPQPGVANLPFSSAETQRQQFLVHTGNRLSDPPGLQWVLEDQVLSVTARPDIMAVERLIGGDAFGLPQSLLIGVSNTLVTDRRLIVSRILVQVERARGLRARIETLERDAMRRLSNQLADGSLALEQRTTLEQEMLLLRRDRAALYDQIEQDVLTLETANGGELKVPVGDIVKVWLPNRMNLLDKALHALGEIISFLSEGPRDSSTQGGIFPALFGTVLMVMLMSLLVTPFGVIAAVYLHEYAKQGPLVRLIRIAVNNLAGVPSIVFGVFGLGFFVYLVGGNIDRLFFSDTLPSPTFGTPGLLWASLTLALLTVPVVIVSTEEGLARIPQGLRDGSLALGATKAETLFNIVLPMASPAVLTGVILALARAAGEVAPLMLVGVVKLAPELPIDSKFPFIHLEQKFMHLGFHIYDVGFQAPNSELARPLVFATALLLVAIVVLLNMTAILLRRRLEQQYSGIGD